MECWASGKICFHDSETVLYLVAVIGNFKDILYRIVQICGHCIIAVISFFFLYFFFINDVFNDRFFTGFCFCCPFHKTPDIIRPLFDLFRVLHQHSR